MHYSKTYASLLASLPKELSENAINYRQLKKVINQLSSDLEALGLGRNVLQTSSDDLSNDLHPQQLSIGVPDVPGTILPKVVYELRAPGDASIQPRLRICLPSSSAPNLQCNFLVSSEIDLFSRVGTLLPEIGSQNVLEDTHLQTFPSCLQTERIVHLSSDSTFYAILIASLESLSHQGCISKLAFINSLEELAASISQSARPISSSRKGFLRLKSLAQSDERDLYLWRQLFSLYMEMEVFESTHERDRGERDTLVAQQKLQNFVELANNLGLALSPSSIRSLEMFLRLNVYILNLKKFHYGNSEAVRKILKKHAKRTALPSLTARGLEELLPLPFRNTTSLPHMLISAIGEVLLPILPHLADYECAICTSLAYKPIRLDCGHFFCVRCLVKMQKAGKGDCPICRSPTVLRANARNLDHALMRFMLDWFPRESKEKGSANEKEAAEEQLQELGLQTDGCSIQ